MAVRYIYKAIVLLALPLVAAFLLLVSRPAGLHFTPVDFADIEGWSDDRLVDAFPALMKSCETLAKFSNNRRLPGNKVGGRAGDWSDFCSGLTKVGAGDNAALKTFLEVNATPLEVSLGSNTIGTFTGYYESLLYGSRTQDARFQTPLYMRPTDLVMVDLGTFRSDLKGRRIAGRVKGGRLVPYEDRKAIDAGALDGRSLELIFVDDPVDAFFLHIQGSGRVKMDDGTFVRVGYAAQNGQPYYAIGRSLIERGEVAREDMSMQAIRAWMKTNPAKAVDLMQENRSFIFFRDLGPAAPDDNGPFGSAGVTLTPGRSLAVDRKHLPLHAPLFLSATHPTPDGMGAPQPFNRLMVAQDTGGAITGEIRGDVFWGFGADAEAIAGRMANAGRYWLLLPNKLAARVVEEQR